MDLKNPGSRRDSWMKKKNNVAGLFFGSLLRAFVVIGALVIVALGVIIVKQVVSTGEKKSKSGTNTSNYADGDRDELLTAEPKKKEDADDKSDDDKKKEDNKKTISGSIDYNVPVIVLNGTETPGLAGEWVNRLKDAGFTNVQPGNYFSETTGTKVYSSDGSGAALTELFNDAESVKGMIDQVETDVPLSDGQIVVVISSSDDVLSK